MGAGILFREMMSGGFAFGATEPNDGQRQAVRAGMMLAIHAEVSIPDFDRFIADPLHAGSLGGTLDVPGWGEAIPATTGVFRLFSPSEEPRLKLMVYELGFSHDGRSYYLAGRKEVRDDPGLDLWRDTTTLFTRLHEGPDAAGPVIGAGVLSLGIADLIRLCRSMRVTHANSLAEKAAVIARFGGMFLGELWDSYGIHSPAAG